MTIEAAWKSYERRVLADDAPAIQRSECRIAFYGGAAAALAEAYAELAYDRPRNAVELQVKAMLREVAAFIASIRSD